MAIKTYKNTGRVLFGFTLHKNVKQAIMIGLLSSITFVSSAIGYLNAYPTESSRKLIALAFNSNTGIKALIGKPENIDTIAGFTAWRSLGAMVLIISVWAIFLSTRLFRGDEEQGRLELILTGKTSLGNSTAQLFKACATMLIPTFFIVLLSGIAINYLKNLNWQLAGIVFVALSIFLTAFMFISIGALISQLAATRALALKISAIVFGLSFLLRALGDVTNTYSWLSALSPLGWIERLRPLTANNYLWLIPILLTIIICVGLSIKLANSRDYNSSLIPDKDSAEPKYNYLNSGNGLLIRLHRVNAFSWAVALFVANFIFGTFLGAVNEALKDSNGMQNVLNNVTNTTSVASNYLFIGLIYMIMILALLIMVSGQLNNFREEEARGYLDNLLVRQSSRLGLISTKTLLIIGSVFICCAAIVMGTLIGAYSQNIDLNFSTMVGAGLNLLAVPILLLGIGLIIFGFLPRLTSIVLYSIIGWAFVIEIIGSVINLNHYVLDSSILHHIALAPAADVKWDTFTIYIVSGLALSIIGIWRFTKRDIELM